MNQHRYFFLFGFIISGLLLFKEWQQDELKSQLAARQAPSITQSVPTTPSTSNKALENRSLPITGASVPSQPSAFTGERIRIETNLYIASINTRGGILESLEFKDHRDSQDKSKPFHYLQNNLQHVHIAQTGLLGQGLPNHTTPYQAQIKHLDASGNSDIILTLTPIGLSNTGAAIEYQWVFHQNSYVIDALYKIKNNTTLPWTANAYFQIERDDKAPTGQAKFISSFNGVGLYNEEEKYKKIEFSDIEKNKASFQKMPPNGWIGMVEHYFVSAWLANPSDHLHITEFYARKSDLNRYNAGMIISQTVQPQQSAQIKVPLYAGPQEQEKLAAIAPGLDLTVDYGMFTIFAVPLFKFLKFLHSFIGNWGWSILLMTLLIRIAFYPLNKTSAVTLAKTKLLAPRIEHFKTLYKDDPIRMQTEIIGLYKKEKVNPAGGCLPVLVQIPIFIALYWVLLSAVELRHAPWIGWIHDLSASDPYFVLPVIYTLTSLIQIHLNPSPAKTESKTEEMILKYLPLSFSFMFFFFPSGMLLYWILSNTLGILQQWHVNKTLIRKGLKPVAANSFSAE